MSINVAPQHLQAVVQQVLITPTCLRPFIPQWLPSLLRGLQAMSLPGPLSAPKQLLKKTHRSCAYCKRFLVILGGKSGSDKLPMLLLHSMQ